MIKSTCECYYDAALHKQSTNCPLHDPYRRCKNLEAHIDQLESEIARLREDQQWLDPGASSLISAFGTFSVERLPDWNFAVAINGDIYGIGMTVFDAIRSAAAQIDKIKATIKDAAIKAAKG